MQKTCRRSANLPPWRPGAACRGAAAAALLLAFSGARAAASSAADVIEGTSACPEPQAVWSALGALIGEDGLERRLRTLPDGGLHPVAVTDLGSAFRVRAGDQSRDYAEAARDCAGRAKVAAVFVALAVDSVEPPGDASRSAPPTPAAPVTAVRSGVAPLPPKRSLAHLEIGVDGQFGAGAWTPAPGASVRVSGGKGSLAIVFGLHGTVPADAMLAGIRVRQWRAGTELALRLRWLQDRSLNPFVELGAVAAVFSARAPDLAVAGGHTTGELGFIAGGGLVFRRRPWGAAFVLVEAEVDPDPPTLSALPTGSLGRTPYVWLRAGAGISVGLF